MRKKKTMIAALLTVAVFMTACGANENVTDTETVSDTQLSESGNPVFDVKERGIEFEISQEYLDKGVEVDGYYENEKGYKNTRIYYYSPESLELYDKVINMTYEERANGAADDYIQKFFDTCRCLMEVVIVENDEYEKAMADGGKAEDFTDFSPAEYYGTNDGYTYVISIPDLDNGKLTDEDVKDYQACKEYMETVKENIKFLPVELENDETVVGEVMPEFKTNDIMGNEVTSEIFGQSDLTVVNIWGTFCGPCIEEMPELAQLDEKYNGKVQFLGIVGDVDGIDDTEHIELAKTITEKAGVKFTNLVVNDDFEDFMEGIIAYPTTIFVDKFGNIVGEPIVGSDIDGTEKTIKSILNENE